MTVTTLFVLKLHFRLHGCASLKEKRSRMAPLLSKLKKENLSVIEADLLDNHQNAIICIARLSLNSQTLSRDLDHLIAFIDLYRGDMELLNYDMERLTL